MNRTVELKIDGKSLELPTVVGSEGEVGIDVAKLRGETGCITLDPGYGNTGSCESAITFIDGEKGILRYRGYEIAELAEKSTFIETSYLLIYGELPTQPELAAFSESAHGKPDDPRGHAPPLRGLSLHRAPDGHPLRDDQRRLLLLPESHQRIQPRGTLPEPRRAPHFPGPHHRRLLPPQGPRPARRLSQVQSQIHRELPPHDVLPARRGRGVETRGRARARPHLPAPRGSRAELLHLHRAHGRLQPGQSFRLLFRRRLRPLGSPPRRRQPGRARACSRNSTPRATTAPSSSKQIKNKSTDRRLMGFGHRVYKNFDPRAIIIKEQCDKVLAQLHKSDPLLEIAKKLEEIALTTTTSFPASSTRTWISTAASSCAPSASRRTCSP